MNINLDDRYVRADDFQSRVEGLEFTPQIWAVFAKLDQARTAAEVAAELKLEVAAVSQAFGALGDAALIKKKVVGWNAFAAAASTPAPAAAPAPKVDPTLARHPEAGLPALAPAPADADKSAICFRIASPAALQAITTPVVHLTLGKKVPEPVATGGCKLRPVLDAISTSAGGGIPGQLLVYKVFLQLPADLMKAAGLTSLAAVNDETTVANPALRDALVAAAKQHAKIDVSALVAA